MNKMQYTNTTKDYERFRMFSIKSIKTIESFTTTPANATRPNILNIVKGIPSKAWPNTAPAHPNGIIAMIRSG